jgi:peptide/nickel transport system ATP-binding protein
MTGHSTTGSTGARPAGTADAVLEAGAIRIELASGAPIVDDVALTIAPGEILGLVGESGSGKTTTALSLFGYNGADLTMSSGEIAIAGERLSSPQLFRRARGRLVSYVPQNPGTALNPALRIGRAIQDTVRDGRDRRGPDDRRGPEERRGPGERRGPEERASGAGDGRRGSEAASLRLLERVGLPADREFGRRYPHQLSGGQQQRVCIAASIAPDPVLVVLDEPTTGLDVVTQNLILEELLRLRDEQDVAMLYITHDLAVVAQIATRIAVMYAGHLVEQGPAAEILRRPQHPYTRGLLAATPDHLRPRILEAMPGIAPAVEERSVGCPFAPRCGQRVSRCDEQLPALESIGLGHEVRCFEWRRTPAVSWAAPVAAADRAEATERLEPDAAAAQAQAPVLEVVALGAEYHSGRTRVPVVADVSFTLHKGACIALVGESGSGKTTIARAIAGLHTPSAGQILLAGEPLPGLARKRTTEQRRRVQIVFQNPADALNPRHEVLAAVARPAQMLLGSSRAESEREAERLLETVRLPARIARHFPGELSGGQLQRVAIARALAARPEVLVCDEITSALDVSVQAVVLELLRDLRRELDLSIIFISHDLGVVATVAEQLLVLDQGSICERGATAAVLAGPTDPYTARLLAAAPSLSSAIESWDALE